MPRTLHADMKTAAAAETGEIFHLFDLGFSGGTLYLTDASNDVTWNGNAYTAIGGLPYDAVQETTVLGAQTVRLTLDGVDTSIITRILQQNYIGQTAIIRFAHMATDGTITSNPVIVYAAVNGDRDRWIPVLDELVRKHAAADEDELAWKLIEALGVEAAKLLLPVYEETDGKKGFLSMQVNPKFYRSAEKMTAHAIHLAALAPNIAIKLPAVEAGIVAMEEVSAAGINVNATVSFSVAQACAAAAACDRGMKRAKDASRLHPYTTIMVGRVDDHLKRILKAERVSIDPGLLEWAGIAVFKRARREFADRGYKSTLLAAAYRNVMQWTELIGDNVILNDVEREFTRHIEEGTDKLEDLLLPDGFHPSIRGHDLYFKLIAPVVDEVMRDLIDSGPVAPRETAV